MMTCEFCLDDRSYKCRGGDCAAHLRRSKSGERIKRPSRPRAVRTIVPKVSVSDRNDPNSDSWEATPWVRSPDPPLVVPMPLPILIASLCAAKEGLSPLEMAARFSGRQAPGKEIFEMGLDLSHA